MAHRFNDLTLTTLSDLVVSYTKFKIHSDEYEYFFAKALSALQNCSPSYASKEDINNKIAGLVEKYGFHGYLKQGQELQSLSLKFLGMQGKNVNREEYQTRLNVMKFVLEMSTRPTSVLASIVSSNSSNEILEEDDTNWSEYLMEGIERWNPPAYTDSSDYSSEEDEKNSMDLVYKPDYKNSVFEGSDTLIRSDPSDITFLKNREEYEEHAKVGFKTYDSHLQHTWFNTYKTVRHLPESNHPEATTALQWERCLENITGGLLKLPELNIISEYKVIREMIFEMYFCHETLTFKYCGNTVDVKDNITISSARPDVFQNFISQQFSPYINTLHAIETYCKDTMLSTRAPDTYRSFCGAVNEIFLITIKHIGAIEKVVQKQEETYTLIRLATEFRSVFNKVTILKTIIDQIPDFLNNNVGYCASHLIKILLQNIYNSTTKLEQDLMIYLLLESTLSYMNIIDSWLSQDDLHDPRDELPRASHFDSIQKSGSFFSILINEVEQLGKNVHLLKRFGKLGKLKPNQTSGYISLHKEFIENVIKEMARYSGVKVNEEAPEASPRKANYPSFFNPDVFKFSANEDQSENLPDMSDRFLIAAFRDIFVEDEEIKTKETLFERISGITKGFVCTHGLIETALLDSLRSRYGESGNIVRDTLRNEYRILDHIKMMNHLYLFKDGIIFDFFVKLSKKINNCEQSFNPISLTLMLQDILMDIHPEFFEKVSVNANGWEECDNETLAILRKINVNYKMDWPVTSIIMESQMKLYKDIFTLILQIKWSVYTLSNLQLSDNKIRHLKGSKKKYLSILKRRLQILRFSLLNTMSYIQHFIFGSVFFKSSVQLEVEWNKAGNGEEFRQAHEHYITEMHSSCAKLNNSFVQDSNVGFYELLVTVSRLRLMEDNLRSVKDEELTECENSAKLAHRNITNVINSMQYLQSN